MVSRGFAADAAVDDPTQQNDGGLLTANLEDEGVLLDVSPELLELLAEVNCLRTSIINSVGGDRHPEVEGKPREEPPKRPRGTPPQDSPPEAPSPKRMNDGVGGMDRDLGAEQPDPVTAD